jgi:beta-glucosidase-like glycosyl hydrolase/CubicO group peptidase (beta-lactamase class C family)
MRLKKSILLFAAMAAVAFNAHSSILTDAESKAARHWADSVYNTLSERQRVAQLICPTIDPKQGDKAYEYIKRMVATNDVGALLFSEGSIDQYANMLNYVQSIAKVPVLITFDGEWGLSMRIKDTPRFPRNMGLGAITDEKLLYDYGYEMGRECRELGVHVNFAPVADVNSNPANPVIGDRSFGEDPQRVARLVSAYSRGLEDAGVQSVAKHFPGHGDTSTDSHKSMTTVNRNRKQLDAVEFVPFRQYINDGLSGIMVGHIAVPAIDSSGTPSSLSKKFYSILRNEFGFRGLTYTDALGMKGAVSKKYSNNAVAALVAGADILLTVRNNGAGDIDDILKAMDNGTISKKIIEERVKRVLAYKYALGLPQEKAKEVDNMAKRLNSPTAELVNRRLSAASITVPVNKGDILPLSDVSTGSIAVVSIGEDSKNKFSEICNRYAGVDMYYTKSGAFSESSIAKIKAHKTVIAVVFNDKSGSIEALEGLAKSCDNLIEVFMVNPYKTLKFKSAFANAKAVVLAYDDTALTREYAAQAIFGGINVSGKTPVNMPGLAPMGTGVYLEKNRLGYTVPEAVGMRASLIDSIDSIAADGVAKGAFPGCQIVVGRHGNIILNKAYGLLTAEGDSVTTTTLYDLASVSKALGTLPGVMLAYDRGLIDLDAPASKYIPGFNNEDKKDITIKEMLFHESGMPASVNTFNIMFDTTTYKAPLITSTPDKEHTIKIQNKAYGDRNARLRTDVLSTKRTAEYSMPIARDLWASKATYDTIMGRIYTIPLRKNKNFTYSCLNFCLLMDAEQHVTGIDHQTWCSTNIWEPLGAWSVCYRPLDRFKLEQIAPTEEDTYLRKQLVHGYVHDETAAFSGGLQGNAGLFANANDLAKICQMWLNGGTYGGQQILSPETVELFTTAKSPTCRRGLGFDKPDMENKRYSPTCDEANASVYGHLGFTGTVFWVDPENDLFFIFLNNRVNPTRDNQAFSSMNLRPEMFRQVLTAIK